MAEDQPLEGSAESVAAAAGTLPASIIEASPIGMMMVNAEGLIVLVNAQCEATFGYAMEDILGKPIETLMPERLRAGHVGLRRRFLEAPQARRMGQGQELLGLRANGEEFPIQVGLGPLTTPEGRFVVATVRDLSESHAKEEELAAAGRLIEQSHNETYVFETDTLRFDFANQAALDNLGYRIDELRDLTPLDLTPAFDRDGFLALVAPLLSGEKEKVTIDTWHRRADGSRYEVCVNLRAGEYRGRRRFIALVLDVTDRIMAEQQRDRAISRLAESEARYRTLYEQAPVMHANVSPDDATIVDCNQKLVERLGYTAKSEIVGRPIWDVYHESSLRRARRAFDDFVAKGAVSNVELTLVSKHGGAVPVMLNVASVRDSQGRTLFSSSTWSDITEIKGYITDLERANRDLEQFAYIASHDLKAPLRGIDHLTTWLTEDLGDELNEESRRHVAQLRQRVARMSHLLDDLLAYSRAGRGVGDSASIDLGVLLDQVLDLVSVPEGFSVDRRLEVKRIDAFHTPLETVLRNLISNALKHHDRDTGRVIVESKPNGEGVLFRVCDDGPGIPPEFRDRAFRIFQTLRPRDEVEGSGMGLAIVKKIVEAQDGRIWLEDTSPRGTAICFVWPSTPTAVWDSDEWVWRSSKKDLTRSEET